MIVQWAVAYQLCPEENSADLVCKKGAELFSQFTG